MRTKRPPRLRAFDYRGRYRYLLTICTAGRRRPFAVHPDAREIATQFLRHAASQRFAVPAYCVMPDHLHALVEGRVDDADFVRFVHRFKQATGFDWRRSRQDALWQEGYYDRVLREEEASLDVIAYIARNPVTAGLSSSISAYPLFGSSEYSVDGLVQLLGEWEQERATDKGFKRGWQP